MADTPWRPLPTPRGCTWSQDDITRQLRDLSIHFKESDMSQARFTRFAAAAALTLAACAPSFAAGEFLDIELPSMRTPIESTVQPTTRAQVQ